MIQFELGRLWWLIRIPIFLLFVFVLGKVNKNYVIPSFYEVQELLRGIESNKERFGVYMSMLIALLIYSFLLLYVIAFIVQLTLEAELSLIGFLFFLMYILFSMFIKNWVVNENKKKSLNR